MAAAVADTTPADDMSPDVLRRAAALMRERAEVATDGPWDLDSNGCCVGAVGQRGERYFVLGQRTGAPVANLRHAASWHPAVALAVADWLDAEARWADIGAANSPQDEAVTVARAYLGETP